jgi:hypothetical protein
MLFTYLRLEQAFEKQASGRQPRQHKLKAPSSKKRHHPQDNDAQHPDVENGFHRMRSLPIVAPQI